MEVGTSYNQIWPFFVLIGAGLALTMPSTSALGMCAVDRTRAGIASGVVNASRQVGGAIGIAVLGSITAKVAVDNWLSSSAAAALPNQGHAAEDLVVGGQTELVGQAAGPDAATAASHAFVQGMQVSMYVAAALCLVAAGLAATVLKVRVTAAVAEQAPSAAPVPAPPVEV